MKDLPDAIWDAVVVGAGPAGGVAAAMLASRGRRVLLVEKSKWPREKTCGGCLNALAVQALRQTGLDSALANSIRVDLSLWHAGNQSLPIPTPGGAAVLRSEMDAAIVAAAENRGCTFLSSTRATLLPARPADPWRTVRLQNADTETTVRTRLLLACDGINGTSSAAEPWAKWKISRSAWIGLSTTCNQWPVDLQVGTIHMHVGPGGYVGLVRLRDGRVHLAAALDPAAAQNAGGPAPLITEIFRSCQKDSWNDLRSAKFRGTPAFTRRRHRIGGHRVLAVGDACGYVEPFTGEGMGWAIQSARDAVQLLPDSPYYWPADLPDRWRALHAQTIVRNQRWCRALRLPLHHPRLVATALAAAKLLPPAASFLASRISRISTAPPLAAAGGA